MYYGNDFIFLEKLLDNLSLKKFDGGGYVALVRHAVRIVGSCERHGFFEEYMSCVLFIYTLRGNPMHWCATLPKKSIHSLAQLVAEIDRAFNHFDCKALNQEILKLRKEPDESVEQFHTCFCNLACQFPEDDIDWEFLDRRFEYLLYISKNLQFLKSLESRSYFGDGIVKSRAGTVTVTRNCPPSPHQTTPPLRSDVGDHAHTFVELSHRTTPPPLNICTDLACKPIGCHVDSFPRPPSSCFVNPLDCTALCSSILNSSPIVDEDQVVDGVGIMQPTCAIIHEECVWKSKEEPTVKDDSLPATPHPLHPEIPCDSTTTYFPSENPLMNVSTSDHSQDMSNVSLSSQCGEDTSSYRNLSNLSSVIFENIFAFHPPLYPIHQNMRMPTNI